MCVTVLEREREIENKQVIQVGQLYNRERRHDAHDALHDNCTASSNWSEEEANYCQLVHQQDGWIDERFSFPQLIKGHSCNKVHLDMSMMDVRPIRRPDPMASLPLR